MSPALLQGPEQPGRTLNIHSWGSQPSVCFQQHLATPDCDPSQLSAPLPLEMMMQRFHVRPVELWGISCSLHPLVPVCNEDFCSLQGDSACSYFHLSNVLQRSALD